VGRVWDIRKTGSFKKSNTAWFENFPVRRLSRKTNMLFFPSPHTENQSRRRETKIENLSVHKPKPWDQVATQPILNQISLLILNMYVKRKPEAKY
jgi:hypothetical protein